jgi:hypothetical protein
MGDGFVSRQVRKLKESAAVDRRLANDYELVGQKEYARYLRRSAEATEFEAQVLEQESQLEGRITEESG